MINNSEANSDNNKVDSDNEIYNAGVEARNRGLGFHVTLYLMKKSVTDWDKQDTEDFERGYKDASKKFNPLAS